MTVVVETLQHPSLYSSRQKDAAILLCAYLRPKGGKLVLVEPPDRAEEHDES